MHLCCKRRYIYLGDVDILGLCDVMGRERERVACRASASRDKRINIRVYFVQGAFVSGDREL